MQEDARKNPADGTTGASPELLVQKFSPLPTNSRLGELSIQSVLGAGENAITYICLHEANNRRFVVKEYLPRSIAFRDGTTVRVSSANTPAYAWGLDRFLNEARALVKIKHQAIVPVLAAIEGNGTGYVVMAHEVGRDLGIWQHELRRPPTQLECDKVIEQLLDGVAMLHNKDILHLDIQPAHIIIRDGGTPVLVDFGSVRLAMRKRLQLPTPTEARPFMAPEVLVGDQNLIGPYSDIYSLGGVLYSLVTGTRPPEAERRALRDTLVPSSEAAKAKYRAGFLRAIDAGLAYRLDDRPQKVSDWLADLLRPETAPARKQTPARSNGEVAADNENSDTDPRTRSTSDYDAQSEPAEALMDNPSFRPLFFGLAGGMVGAVIGALSSIVIASVVWSSCMTDSCVAPVLPYTTLAGLAAGLFAGVRYGSLTAHGAVVHRGDMQDDG